MQALQCHGRALHPTLPHTTALPTGPDTSAAHPGFLDLSTPCRSLPGRYRAVPHGGPRPHLHSRVPWLPSSRRRPPNTPQEPAPPPPPCTRPRHQTRPASSPDEAPQVCPPLGSSGPPKSGLASVLPPWPPSRAPARRVLAGRRATPTRLHARSCHTSPPHCLLRPPGHLIHDSITLDTWSPWSGSRPLWGHTGMDYASHTRPRTPAQARVHTLTLHTRAHGSWWPAGAAFHPLPARAHQHGRTAHTVLAR